MKRPKCSTSHEMLGKTKYEKELEKYIDYLEQKVAINTDIIDLVSGCFPDDKEIELHSNVHSDDSDFRPNTYSSYKEGIEDCIELIKEKLNYR